jgi:diguanylate cyclase (GGDEF)-like protein
VADGNFNEAKAASKAASYRKGRDRIALAIAGAAIVLFVITGGTALSQAVQSIRGIGMQPNPLAVSAMLLNIALILLGWRHHTNLSQAITVHRHAEEEARQLAETDVLTGMLNRRSFAVVAGAQIAENAKSGRHAALIMADLDRFKQINDLHGHAVGDAVLRDCAQRIALILPDRALAARLGGDEFAFLVPLDAAYPDRIDQLANALIEVIAAPMVVADAKISVTVSLGISRSDIQSQGDPGEPLVEAMLHSADIAMYHAKRQGRHCYFWFEPAMESELRFRRQLEAEIQSGIEHGEFVPYYEQQIDLKSGKLTGFEMLARWKSPKYGIVNPQTFIPIAEDLGVIDVLSEQLIAQALQDAKAWDPKLSLSVNISPIQLRDPWFSQKLLKLLVESNFPAQRLEIEITESCVHENIGAVRVLLASLKNQGIRISLDDFGTGYSSIGQLRELPFDCIKIDRSFVMGLAEDQDSATLMRTITALGEGLGLPMTAEGIETEAVLEQLQAYGDFKGQGYLYGKPETAAATLERLGALDLLQTPAPAQPAEFEPVPSEPGVTPKRSASQG